MRKGWTETTLDEVLEPVVDRAGEKQDFEVLSVTEKRGIIPQTEVFKNRIATEDISKYKVIRPGDIAFNPYLLWCGAVGQWKGENDGVVSPVYECFRVRKTDFPRFVGLIFESGYLTPYFDSTAIGSIIRRRRTTLPIFLKAPISRPPLNEQKRIVDVMSSVDDYIHALQQQADAARAARNAVLHKLLSAHGESWTETTLGKVLSLLTDGSHFSPESVEEGLPYVTVRDVKNGLIDTSSCAKISQDSFNELVKNGCAPEAGDVLFSKDGTVGKVALVVEGQKFVVLSSLAILRPNTNLVTSEFLAIAISSGDFQAAATGSKTGLAIKRVVLKVMRELEFRYPSPSEQKEIVETVSSMDAVIQSTEQALVNAKSLRTGLLADLLSGNHEIPASYDSFLGAA